MRKTIMIVIGMLILLSVSVFAYTFSYPTPYYWDGKENIKVNKEFIEQFENYTPEYLKDKLDIEFTTRRSNYWGYTYCHSKPNGRIEITIYRDGWVDYSYEKTEWILEHELKHVWQCRILNEYPHHEEI